MFLVAIVFSLLLQSMKSEERVSWETNNLKGSPTPPAPLKISRIAKHIDFQQPVDFRIIPGTQTLMVAEQGGKLWSLGLSTPPQPRRLILDLRKHYSDLANLLAFTFHPEFAKNGWIYLNYNFQGETPTGAHLSRFVVSQTAEGKYEIDPASEWPILQWPSGGHNGCSLMFGPKDGMLYISTGDGSGPDPPDSRFTTGQDLSDLMGAVLRIDVNGTEATRNYRIPENNPFVGVIGARPEIWAFGFRNPWRMSFNPESGSLWLGDVGWEQWEMIHKIAKGGNYGWPINEGPNHGVRTDVKKGPGEIRPAVIALPHSEAASITGGIFYFGAKLPQWAGSYIFGDWETGKLWALKVRDDVVISNSELCDTTLKIVSFCLDTHGEILVLDHNGGIYALDQNHPVANDQRQNFPTKLSKTGLFKSLRPLLPQKGVYEYFIRAPKWNDTASARWHLGIPGKGSIHTTGGVSNIAGPTWYYPTNTVLSRTLSLDVVQNGGLTKNNIETQLLHWNGQAWQAYSYRWNDHQTEATLVAKEGAWGDFIVQPHIGSKKPHRLTWRFHSRSECMRCHNQWAGESLTLNHLQLGGPHFQRLAALKLITDKEGHSPQPSRPSKKHLANPYDPSSPIADRARSWLHVNCSTCHQMGAGGGIPSQFNIQHSLSETRSIDIAPSRGQMGMEEAAVIASGNPFNSTLLYRIASTDLGHMPPIGSEVLDIHGYLTLVDWIQSLSADEKSEANRRLSNTSIALERFTQLLRVSEVTEIPSSDLLSVFVQAEQSPYTQALIRRWLPTKNSEGILGMTPNLERILELEGEPKNGKQLYFGLSGCIACHTMEGAGNPVGPDLVQSAKKHSRLEFLKHIVDPSAQIDKAYRLVDLQIRQQPQTITGFILRQTENTLWMRDLNQVTHTIDLTEIEWRQEWNQSLMPEALLSQHSAKQAADLLAYIFSQATSP